MRDVVITVVLSIIREMLEDWLRVSAKWYLKQVWSSMRHWTEKERLGELDKEALLKSGDWYNWYSSPPFLSLQGLLLQLRQAQGTVLSFARARPRGSLLLRRAFS